MAYLFYCANCEEEYTLPEDELKTTQEEGLYTCPICGEDELQEV